MSWIDVSYKLPSDKSWAGNGWTAECGFGDGCYDAYDEYQKLGNPDGYDGFEKAAGEVVRQLVAEDAEDGDIRQFTVGGITWDICLGALWDK